MLQGLGTMQGNIVFWASKMATWYRGAKRLGGGEEGGVREGARAGEMLCARAQVGVGGEEGQEGDKGCRALLCARAGGVQGQTGQRGATAAGQQTA